MQHKLLFENWRKFANKTVVVEDQQIGSSRGELKFGPGMPDTIKGDLEIVDGVPVAKPKPKPKPKPEAEPDAVARKPDPKAYKGLPIINGINLLFPMTGNRRIHASYNQKRGKGIHGAIDQNVPIGTECVAVADGKVVEVIDQVTYDKNCAQFINIMLYSVFGAREAAAIRYARNLVYRAQKYANGRGYYFYGRLLRRRLRSSKFREKVFEKLASLPKDWNGIRAFQDFLTKLGHRNFCAMFMRYLLIRGKVNRRMMAGKYIKILTDPDQKGRQWELSYMHMNSYKFKVGDKVKAGQVIGESGATAIADDPAHLHFVLRRGRNGPRLDPTKYIPGLGNRLKPQKLN
tara:strand:- start:3887 stop:4924 length:1038 start_codon:yes stop_codon:yes gene_type:complete